MKHKVLGLTRRRILTLAWPSVVEQILLMLIGVLNTMFVGHVGKDAMAAVGMVNTLMNFLQVSFSGLAFGATVVIARMYGEGDRDGAREALKQALMLCIAIGVTMTILCFFLREQIIGLFFGGATEAVTQNMNQYFSIVLFGILFMVFDTVVSGAVRGAGDTKTPMQVTIIENVVNVVLGICLIFGVNLFGKQIIPSFGLVGAGIAITAARVISGSLRVLLLFVVDGRINLYIKDKFRLSRKLIHRILHVGLPSMLEQAIMQGGFLVVQMMLTSLGATATAAYVTGSNFNSIAYMTVFGISIATTTLVGQSLGMRKYNEAKQYSRQTLLIGSVIGISIGLLMVVFATPCARLYSQEPDVIHAGANIIRQFGFMTPFLVVMTVYSSVLKAAGEMKGVIISAICGLWISRIFLGYVLMRYFHMGLNGLMIGIGMDFFARSVLYAIWIHRGKWLYKKV